jgi:hypothetical protein
MRRRRAVATGILASPILGKFGARTTNLRDVSGGSFSPAPAVTRRLPIFPLLCTPLAAADKITYEDHIFPLFQQTCLNCHNPDKARGGLDLSTYGGAMKGGSGGKIVEPGDLGSKLVALVKQTAEPAMPPEGDKLGPDQIALLEKWIEGGLLETKSSSARKPTKPKFETALRSDPAARPEGPPPIPEHVLLDPPVVTERASTIHALAASPWAPLLAVTGQRQVLLYHTETLELLGVLPFPEGQPISLSFTPEARYLVVGGGIGGKSGVTVTFDVTNGERLLVAGKEFDSVLASDIRPGFDIVATGGPSRLLKLWKTETGEQVQSVKKHTEWITALDISPDGVLLASGDRNGGVWVWESDTANEFHTLRGHDGIIVTAEFRADSNLLATASGDGSVRFWEMNNGNEVKKVDAHPGGVTDFSFARDGRSLTAGRDMKAKLWKADFNLEREIVQNLPALPTAVALDAEATRAFVGDARGTVRAYDTAEGKPLGEIQANPPAIATRLVRIAAETDAIAQQLREAEAAAAAQASKVEEARAAVAVAETRQAEMQAAVAAAMAAIGEETAKLEALRQQLSAKRDEIAASVSRRDAARQQAQSLAGVAEDQRDEAAVTTATEELKDAEAVVATKEAEVDALAAAETAQDAKIRAAAQMIEAAEAETKAASEAVSAAQSALTDAEEMAAEATAAVAPLQESATKLEASRKRWTAADINTRALAAARNAAQAELEHTVALEEYTAGLAAFDESFAKLQTKREERQHHIEQFDASAAAEEAQVEHGERLTALDKSIAKLEEAVAGNEREVTRLREISEQAGVAAHQAALEAKQLKDAYLEALR